MFRVRKNTQGDSAAWSVQTVAEHTALVTAKKRTDEKGMFLMSKKSYYF